MDIKCSQGHTNPLTNKFCQTCGQKLIPPINHGLSSGMVLEGRYRIINQLGQGGFGRTYLCEDLNRFKELCVLKEFAPQVQGTQAIEKAQRLFEREAGVLYKLQHPQIPRFRELFRVTNGSSGLFLLQDFVPGYNYRYLLHQRLSNQKPFTEVEIIKIMQQILPVLDYIHSCGVIHRDISPDNLICRQVDQLPILIDFGGVKQLSANAEFQFVGGHDGSTATPTRLGKIGYAPNEQIQRGIVFPHSDLYALGATMLVLLSGVEPKEMINPRDFTWEWHRFVTLSPGFAAIIDRMLKSKPNDRFQTAKELMNALEELDYPDQSVVNKGGITPLSANVHEEPTTLTPQPSPQLPPQSAPLWQQYWLWVVGLLVAIALGITLFTIFSRDQNNGVKQRQRSFQLNVPSALVKPSPQSYH